MGEAENIRAYETDLEGRFESLQQTYNASGRDPQAGIVLVNFLLDEYFDYFTVGNEEDLEQAREEMNDKIPCDIGVKELLGDLVTAEEELDNASASIRDAKEAIEGYINQMGW